MGCMWTQKGLHGTHGSCPAATPSPYPTMAPATASRFVRLPLPPPACISWPAPGSQHSTAIGVGCPSCIWAGLQQGCPCCVCSGKGGWAIHSACNNGRSRAACITSGTCGPEGKGCYTAKAKLLLLCALWAVWGWQLHSEGEPSAGGAPTTPGTVVCMVYSSQLPRSWTALI